jgi:hypothetical protein
MPKPPPISQLEELNFVTGYFLQGCQPDFWLFCEFAKEPAGDLFLVLFSLDIQDIIKEWLRPVRHRFRDPARHGRKRTRSRLSLDPNEYLSTRLRAKADLYPGLKLPGAKALFLISDVTDFINISAAVIEGVSDIAFAGVLGVLQHDPSNCPSMIWCRRHSTGETDDLGVIPVNVPIVMHVFDGANNFQIDGPYAYTSFSGDWRMTFSGTIRVPNGGKAVNWRPAIYSEDRGVVETGSPFTLQPGETGHFTVEAGLSAGEIAFPTRVADSVFAKLENMQVFCYQGGLF